MRKWSNHCKNFTKVLKYKLFPWFFGCFLDLLAFLTGILWQCAEEKRRKSVKKTALPPWSFQLFPGVRPLGFDISERAVKRAGLDYWHMVDLRVYDSLD